MDGIGYVNKNKDRKMERIINGLAKSARQPTETFTQKATEGLTLQPNFSLVAVRSEPSPSPLVRA